MDKRKTISIPEDRGRHLMPVVWGLLALAILLGVFWLSYSVSPGNHPAEYEAVVVEKWANYSETDEGSVPTFRLLVELTNGQKLTIRVGPDLYNEVKVGSRIRKSSKGLELVKAALDKSDKAGCIPHETTVIGLASKVFLISASPSDVRRWLCPAAKLA